MPIFADEFQFSVKIPRDDMFKVSILAQRNNMKFHEMIDPYKEQIKSQIHELASQVELDVKVNGSEKEPTTEEPNT